MGSWNWSKTAQRQDNSDVVLYDCPEEVKKFGRPSSNTEKGQGASVGDTTVSAL